MKHGILTFFTEFIHFLTLTLFFFNDTATTEIYTLSLHDALPIYDVPTALLDDFLDSLPLVELGLLLQEPDGIAFGKGGLPEVVLVHTRDDAQQRALARAVQPEDADLGPVIEGQVDILEHLLLGRVHAAHADEGKDDLLIRWAHRGAVDLERWCPQRDLNPCCGLERAAS